MYYLDPNFLKLVLDRGVSKIKLFTGNIFLGVIKGALRNLKMLKSKVLMIHRGSICLYIPTFNRVELY